MRKRSKHPFVMQYLIELLMVAIIILTLMGIAARQYIEYQRYSGVVVAVAETAGLYRAPLSAYYALHGQWPTDMDQVRDLLPDADRHGKNYETGIDNGTLAVRLKGFNEGRALTMRPAVPSGDPLGPVHYVVRSSPSPGWIVAGDDHTTVDVRYISADLR